MSRTVAEEERQHACELLEKARDAMLAIEHYDQAGVDRLCRAIAWATYNEPTAKRLANMSVDESGLGDREPRRRAKIMGVLRDALRQNSVGIIEEIPEKGIVKYGKPAGVIASGSADLPLTSSFIAPVSPASYLTEAMLSSAHAASLGSTSAILR